MDEDKLNLELRHVEPFKLAKLASIIDKTRGWTDLIDRITRPVPPSLVRKIQPLKISLEAIDIIEQQFYCGKSPTLALFNYWSITGRIRPTVRTLLFYLSACNLKWSEKYARQAILGIEDEKVISIQQAPAVVVTPNANVSEGYSINAIFKFDDLREVLDGIADGCPRYTFRKIYESTNRFCHRPHDFVSNTGTLLGDGRFSSVFLASAFQETDDVFVKEKTCKKVAAKLLKSECNKKYLINEINLARKINHPNILQLLGLSIGSSDLSKPTYMCLIYPYMQNGNLLNCLSSGLPCSNRDYLGWLKRVDVAIRIAEGIAFLHNFDGGAIIHRDIKTANILVDKNLEPKLGDFTLVRQLDSLRQNETHYSQNVIGTSVYMPPEAFRGDISTKFDIFSFGIVLLELITGMPPYSESIDGDLFTFISERLSDIDDKQSDNHSDLDQESDSPSCLQAMKDGFLEEILDTKAGRWDSDAAKGLFEIALRATESRKKDRPDSNSIVKSLGMIQSRLN